MTNNSPATKYRVLMSRLQGEPDSTRIKAIQLFLMSELRYLAVEDVLLIIRKLLKNDELEFENLDKEITGYKQYFEPLHSRLSELLDNIGRAVTGGDIAAKSVYAKLDVLAVDINQLGRRIIEAGKIYDKNIGTIDEALAIVSNISSLHQQAMYSAVEIIIQRLLESLNPDSLENNMDNSIINLGPLKKVAMFNALQDKYQQILAYHEEGKMLRDFKVHYKSELKSLKKGDPN